MEIDLPDGRTIDIGWVPDRNPNGAYRLSVFKDFWDDSSQVFADDVGYIVELVESFYAHAKDAIDESPCLITNISPSSLDLSTLVID